MTLNIQLYLTFFLYISGFFNTAIANSCWESLTPIEPQRTKHFLLRTTTVPYEIGKTKTLVDVSGQTVKLSGYHQVDPSKKIIPLDGDYALIPAFHHDVYHLVSGDGVLVHSFRNYQDTEYFQKNLYSYNPKLNKIAFAVASKSSSYDSNIIVYSRENQKKTTLKTNGYVHSVLTLDSDDVAAVIADEAPVFKDEVDMLYPPDEIRVDLIPVENETEVSSRRIWRPTEISDVSSGFDTELGPYFTITLKERKEVKGSLNYGDAFLNAALLGQLQFLL